MRYILGDEPSRVIGSGGRDVNHLDERYGGEQPDILDNAYVIVDFAAGARASLDLCMFAEQSRHQTEIVVSGTEGQVEVGLPEGVVWVGERELPWRPEARREPDRIRTIDVQVDEATRRRCGSALTTERPGFSTSPSSAPFATAGHRGLAYAMG